MGGVGWGGVGREIIKRIKCCRIREFMRVFLRELSTIRLDTMLHKHINIGENQKIEKIIFKSLSFCEKIVLFFWLR